MPRQVITDPFQKSTYSRRQYPERVVERPDPLARPTIREAVERLILQGGWRGQTPQHCRDYMLKGRFASFCVQRGIVTIDDLNNDLVAEFMTGVAEAGLGEGSRRSWRNYFRQLAVLLATLPGWSNPNFTRDAIPRVAKPPRNRTPKALSTGAETALVAAAKQSGKRNSLVVRLLLATGLRVGEACALLTDDLRLTGHPPQIVVRRSTSDPERTKTGLDRRVGFRPPYQGLAAELERYVRSDKSRTPDRRNVFYGLGRHRTPLSVHGVQLLLGGLGEQIGEHVHPHMLRHTWATRLANAGMPIGQLMTLGGWSSLDMVRHYYTEDLDAALAALGRMVIE